MLFCSFGCLVCILPEPFDCISMNKNKFYLTFIAFLICHVCSAQKLYVWCPEEIAVKERTGFLNNQDFNLVIIDGRTIPDKSKVDCDSKTVIQSLLTVIKKSYPACKINILDEAQYYSKSEKGKITIKVAIAAYQAGFGTDVTIGIGSVGGKSSYELIPKGEWNGLVSFYAQIFDTRNDADRKYQKEISEVTSKSNMWGYKTAKSCLNTSYAKANQDLLFFIDNSLLD
jgi:hypothetical protein